MLYYASIYFQNHFEKSNSFKSEQDARRWLDLESAYTDNVRDYKLYILEDAGWRMLDGWTC